jgi:hypothetical protein
VRAPTAEELAAIAAAYLRLTAGAAQTPAPPSRWRAAARELGGPTPAPSATWREAGRP